MRFSWYRLIGIKKLSANKMRSPPQITVSIYIWILLGVPLWVAIEDASKLWTTASANGTLHWLALNVVVTVLLTYLIYASLLCMPLVMHRITLYLGSFRTGNRVRVTRGGFKGRTGTVLKYKGLKSPGAVFVRLDLGKKDIELSPSEMEKIGIRSYLL